MLPLVLLVVALGCLAAGWLLLRSLGPRVRVGRLLAATPKSTVEEARAIAEAGAKRYIRVDGRIDSETEFEDQHHRPLVLRRTRLQIRQGGGWRTIDDRREHVPFALSEGLDSIAIDAEALSDGLVVVPRESEGVMADLGDRAPEGFAADAPVRVRLEQLSSVEHAIVLGVPVLAGSEVRLTAGLGRPLVVTSLDVPEAMRVLAEGRTAVPRAAAALLVAGIAVGAIGLVLLFVEAVT